MSVIIRVNKAVCLSWRCLLVAVSAMTLIALLTVSCAPAPAGSKIEIKPRQVDAKPVAVAGLTATTAQPTNTAVAAKPTIAERLPSPISTTVQVAAAASPPSAPAGQQQPASAQASPSSGLPDDAGAIARVARTVRPAVVQITNKQVALDEFLRPIPVEAGTGSGVIFDQSGLILTNNHVVAGSQLLQVTLADGRIFDARIIGTDSSSDLAVVKIDGSNLPKADLGDSDKLQIGEWVVAIGNALALEGGPTVTAGIVGALDRYIEVQGGNVLFGLIQTDAAINPGNSGGPLLNLQGQVIGINTVIIQAPGAGLGFSIAINRAKPVIDDLLKTGRVIRPWLGITPITISSDLVRRYQLPVKAGVIVARLEPGSPASRAGLRQGDIITTIDDGKIQGVVDLLRALSRHKVGDSIKVKVVRLTAEKVEEQELSIKLEATPA